MQKINIIDYISENLVGIYPKSEAQAIAKVLLEDLLGISYMDWLRNKDFLLSNEQQQLLDDALTRLQQHAPVQQVTGTAHFYNLQFHVSNNVLIPRPETEELVQLIIQNHRQTRSPKILDIGTGSGCIAISLAFHLPKALVSGCDISPDALQTAQRNNQKLGTHVSFYPLDILTQDIPETDLDIIVSNPPYIREKEKAEMHPNVLQFEPGLALFVPDESPLVFYEEISKKAWNALRSGGSLYFEINEYLGQATLAVLEKVGFQHTVLIKDLQGKNRIIAGIKP